MAPCLALISRYSLVCRAVGVLLLCGLCAGCGARAHDPVWTALKAAAAGLGTPKAAARSLAEQQEEIRVAVASYAGTEPLLMMTLASQNAVATLGLIDESAGRQTWADASGITITLEQGIVTQTRGLGHDVMASDVSGLLAALDGSGATEYRRYRRVLDPTGMLRTQSAQCALQRQADQIIERCAGQESVPDFVNTYQSAGIVRSTQWLGPELGPLQIERLQ